MTAGNAVSNGQRRATIFLLYGGALVLAFILLRDNSWRGSGQLHTLMEAVATLLALIVGILSLVRYYSKNESIFLLIGAGFLGTSFLDGFHAIVTSTYFKPFMPSDQPALIHSVIPVVTLPSL